MSDTQTHLQWALKQIPDYPELHPHFEELDAVLAANPDLELEILQGISKEIEKNLARAAALKRQRYALAIDACNAQRKALKKSACCLFNEAGAFQLNDAAALLRSAAEYLESVSHSILSEIPKYARRFKRLERRDKTSRAEIMEFPAVIKPALIPERFRETSPQVTDLSFVKATGPLSGKAAARDMAEFDRALGLTKGAGGESPPDRPATGAQAHETGRSPRQDQPTLRRSCGGPPRAVAD
jgi:hypothetical protein